MSALLLLQYAYALHEFIVYWRHVHCVQIKVKSHFWMKFLAQI